jgi:hypothetical protein
VVVVDVVVREEDDVDINDEIDGRGLTDDDTDQDG